MMKNLVLTLISLLLGGLVCAQENLETITYQKPCSEYKIVLEPIEAHVVKFHEKIGDLKITETTLVTPEPLPKKEDLTTKYIEEHYIDSLIYRNRDGSFNTIKYQLFNKKGERRHAIKKYKNGKVEYYLVAKNKYYLNAYLFEDKLSDKAQLENLDTIKVYKNGVLKYHAYRTFNLWFTEILYPKNGVKQANVYFNSKETPSIPNNWMLTRNNQVIKHDSNIGQSFLKNHLGIKYKTRRLFYSNGFKSYEALKRHDTLVINRFTSKGFHYKQEVKKIVRINFNRYNRYLSFEDMFDVEDISVWVRDSLTQKYVERLTHMWTDKSELVNYFYKAGPSYYRLSAIIPLSDTIGVAQKDFRPYFINKYVDDTLVDSINITKLPYIKKTSINHSKYIRQTLGTHIRLLRRKAYHNRIDEEDYKYDVEAASMQSKKRRSSENFSYSHTYYLKTIPYDRYNRSSVSYSKYKIKKDFNSCLYGLASKYSFDTNYIIPPIYSELSRINIYGNYEALYKCIDEGISYSIMDNEGRVKFTRPYNFNFSYRIPRLKSDKAKSIIYVVESEYNDSVFVLNADFRPIYVYQYKKDVSSQVYNKCIKTEKDGKTSFVFFADTSKKVLFDGKLITLGNNLFIADSQLISLGNNIEVIKTFQSNFIKKGWYVYEFWKDSMSRMYLEPSNQKLYEYVIKMDDAYKWYVKNKYNIKTSKYGSKKEYIRYQYKGKWGILNEKLSIIQQPVWDKIDENYFAYIDGDKYLLLDDMRRLKKFNYTLLSPNTINDQSELRETSRFWDRNYRSDSRKLIFAKNDKGKKFAFDNRGNMMAENSFKYFGDLYTLEGEAVGLYAHYSEDGQLRFINQRYWYGGFTKGIRSLMLNGVWVLEDHLTEKKYIVQQGKVLNKPLQTVEVLGYVKTVNQYLWAHYDKLVGKTKTLSYEIKPNGKYHLIKDQLKQNEFQVGERTFGYTGSYQLFENKCGQVQLFPKNITSLYVSKNLPNNIIIANTASANPYKDPDSRFLHSTSNYLFHTTLNKLSNVPIDYLGSTKDFIVVKDGKSHLNLLDFQLNPLIKKDKIEWINSYGSLYHFKTGKEEYVAFKDAMDSLIKLKHSASFMGLNGYMANQNGSLSWLGFNNTLKATSSKYCFLDQLRWMDSIYLPAQTAEEFKTKFNKNSSAFFSQDKYNKLTLTQKRFYKLVIARKMRWDYEVRVGESSYSWDQFPNEDYFNKRYGKRPEVEEDVGMEYDREIYTDVAMPNRYLTEKDTQSVKQYLINYKKRFVENLQSNDFGLNNTKFLKNGLVLTNYGYNRYNSAPQSAYNLLLSDTGFTLLTLFELVDSVNYKTLESKLLHLISTNAEYWNVKCEADMEPFNLVFFDKSLRFSDDAIYLKNHRDSYIKTKVPYADIKELIKLKYRYLFAGYY